MNREMSVVLTQLLFCARVASEPPSLGLSVFLVPHPIFLVPTWGSPIFLVPTPVDLVPHPVVLVPTPVDLVPHPVLLSPSPCSLGPFHRFEL